MSLKFSELSGWILPDGTWLAVEEWWHLNAIYELKETGCAFLNHSELVEALASGDEGRMRHELARAGFAKVSRGILDAYSLTDDQLKTLQEQTLFYENTDEILVLCEGGFEKRMSLHRLSKLKKPHSIFAPSVQDTSEELQLNGQHRTPKENLEIDLNLCLDQARVDFVRRAKP